MSHKVSKTTLDSRFTIFREVYENPLLYREKNTFLKIKEVKNELETEKESIAKAKKEEISLWENRYEEKKKSMKEVELIFSSKILHHLLQI